MQPFQTRSTYPTIDPGVLDPAEQVSEQLLKDVRGEVLLISAGKTVICQRTAGNLRRRALSWLNMVANANISRYIAGRVSDKGGIFRVVTKEQAFELMARWLVEELRNRET